MSDDNQVPNGTITTGQIWTVAQWNAAWQSKVDENGGVISAPIVAGGTFASPAITGAATLGGVPFAPSAIIDTTDASNITSGTLSGALVAQVNLAVSGNGGVTGELPLANVNPAGTPVWAGLHTFSAGLDSTTGAFNSALTLGGVPVPSFPRTAAEIAVSVTPQNFTIPPGNVLRYGADLTGTTDSAPSFIAAVSVLTNLGGGALIIPRGDYLLNSTVQIASSGVYIRGDGCDAGATRIVNGQTNGAAIQFGDGTNAYSRCGISQVSFGQKSGVTAVAGNCGLRLNKSTNFHLNDIEVFNFPGALYNGIELIDVAQSFFYGTGVQSCLNAGCLIKMGTSANGCVDIYWLNGRSDANAFGWQIIDSQGLYFENCTGFSNNTNAWNILTTGPQGCLNHFYVNCIGDTSGSYNWAISQLNSAYFAQCWGSAQQNTAVNTFADGFFFNGNVTDILMNGCIAAANNGHGLEIGAASRMIIRDFMGGVRASGDGNGKGGALGGNGIQIDTGAVDITILGGMCAFNSNLGIGISGTPTRVRIQDTLLSNNVGGTIFDASKCTSVRNLQGYAPGVATPVTAGASPWTATTLNHVDATWLLAQPNGISGITLDGFSISVVQNVPIFVKAGHTLVVSWATTAPEFTVVSQQ